MSDATAKKEERRKFQAIKGTRDIRPPETALWNRVEQTAHEVFATFGYGEIRLPIFEPTELFARAVGGETDIVSKEMYSFPDRSLDAPAEILTVLELSTYLSGIHSAIEDGEIRRTEQNAKVIDRFLKEWEVFPAIHSSVLPRMFSIQFHCAPKPRPPSAARISSTGCNRCPNP